MLGPGYGEAILIHLGWGRWILVDSCQSPYTKQPAALEYLKAIRVDPAQAVRLIVATHWHDDHIRGISALLSHCTSASIVLSAALRSEEFLTLLQLHQDTGGFISSGISELGEVVKIILERKESVAAFSPIFSLSNRIIFADKMDTGDGTSVKARVSSLSPSDAAYQRALEVFSRMIPSANSKPKRIGEPSPNNLSVVLWIEVGDQRILLGGDLELTSDSSMGWMAIIEGAVLDGQADSFKIPHHGSKTAHHDAIWTQLLSKQPTAIVTPFIKGRTALPSTDDVSRLKALTPYLYATSNPKPKPQKWRNRVVRDTVAAATKSIHGLESGYGHVRLRKPISAQEQPWSVELFGDAIQL